MTASMRPCNPGQPNLDGRSCYGCHDTPAAWVVEISGGSLYVHEIRLCGPCRTELRSAIDYPPFPTPPGDREKPEPPAAPALITDHEFLNYIVGGVVCHWVERTGYVCGQSRAAHTTGPTKTEERTAQEESE